ncbi:MAG: hypothetical protein ABIQ56_00755 [Chitinophagaceae bacterium]
MEKPQKFIDIRDDLSKEINDKANDLYKQIRAVDVDRLDMDSFCRNYFKECHSGRLIFSLRCSAHIIYDSLKSQDKPINEIVFVDYGAGLGTLFMLAAKLPFKKVLYNDHLEEWCRSAFVICKSLGINILHFIKGDIDELVGYCKADNIFPDIIASRNVIEHIYDLEYFFKTINNAFPNCIVYSTTTANYQNPAMHLRHIMIHRNMEKKYFLTQREELAKTRIIGIGKDLMAKAVKLSRGKAMADFDLAMAEFQKTGTITPPPFLHSNTCDSATGVWAEHLLSKSEYEKIIMPSGFSMKYKAGFWDVNYPNPLLNVFAKVMNGLIAISGDNGVLWSPFVCIVARQKIK